VPESLLMAVLVSLSGGEDRSDATKPVAVAPQGRLHLGLGPKIALWTALITAIAVAATATYLYSGGASIIVERQKQQLAASVAVAAARSQARFDAAQRDAIFAVRTPAMATLADAITASPPVPQSTALAIDAVGQLFGAMLDARQGYFDADFLDANGTEVVRVNREATGNVRTAAGDLQDKSKRPYFIAATALAAGGVHVSDIELNQERGAVATPHRPTAHIAAPVYSSAGRLAGVVVINMELGPLFDLIDRTLGEESRHYIVNDAGDYLFAADATKSFGFDLGERHRIQDDFPDLEPLLARTPGPVALELQRDGGTEIAVGQHLQLDANDPSRFLSIVAVMSNNVVLEGVRDLRNRTIVVAIAIILFAAFFAALLAQLIVRPLRSVTAAAATIGVGGDTVDLRGALDRQDETGQLARTIAAMLDEIGLREEKLKKQAQELTRSNQELAQFAYVASHDLQEPLRMVSSYLDLLMRRYEGQLDAEAHEFIGFAVDGATRMKRLINDLLGYSRTGNSALQLAVVQSSDIVATVVSQLGPAIREARATVRVVEPLPKVRVDAAQISRVFQNLIENAIKYRRPGTDPVITVTAARESAEYWRFSVSDNGIGIDPAFREKVFEIFKRLHGRDRYPGTGIGLSVAKLVVERHGGRIWIEPAPDGGSVFYFTIPDMLAGGDK
jgi:signal transduction histidine kinase